MTVTMDEPLYLGDVFDLVSRRYEYDVRLVAAALGIPEGVVRATGWYPISADQARHLCELFGVSFGELLQRLTGPAE